MSMFFSEYFHINPNLLKEYGAVDISLVCDIPLFIDPMLIFNSEKPEYIDLHQSIIKYFHFLYKKSKQGLSAKEIDAWFNFSEVPNNWLGYSLKGNKGIALGHKFAKFLYNNIAFTIETYGISQSQHIEKAMLLYEGSGKDKISDLTVNLIKRFLCEYTESFTKQYIDAELYCIMPVEKAYFNYETESFVSKEYMLPYIINENGEKEYILLTPFDMLREDEPSINRTNFYKSHERIRKSIENESLRTYINNYIAQAVLDYEKNQRNNRHKLSEKTINRIERDAFKELVNAYPELYDYYIKLQESKTNEILTQCAKEFNTQIEKFYVASQNLISLFEANNYTYQQEISAREEAKNRLTFFKHIIEDCDGYKNLYVKGVPVANENDLQRMFRFVWYGTNYKIDAEANNGRGQADFIVSRGANNENIIEFKLASNTSLDHIFTQVKIYEAANCSTGSLIAIFYFTELEYQKAYYMLKDMGYEKYIDESIFLIDCRNDNKPSASIA